MPTKKQNLELGHVTLPFNASSSRTVWVSISKYVRDNSRTENVKTLREVMEGESEFMTTASETISGVLSESRNERAFLAKEEPCLVDL